MISVETFSSLGTWKVLNEVFLKPFSFGEEKSWDLHHKNIDFTRASSSSSSALFQVSSSGKMGFLPAAKQLCTVQVYHYTTAIRDSWQSSAKSMTDNKIIELTRKWKVQK